MTRTAAIIAVLVLLRLATGWHFFNEGVKKLDPDFSSAGFLRQAKGPMASTFRSMVTGPYNGVAHLGGPLEAGSEGADDAVKESINAWLAEIESSWSSGLTRVARLGASDEALEQAAALQATSLAELRSYLDGESASIADLRHEAWRLAKMQAKAEKDPPPFIGERIAAKQNEVWGGMQPWFAAVSGAQAQFAEGVASLVDDESATDERVISALAERSQLRLVDGLVTIVVLGCGILLFLGLFTRVAAVVAAGFLLSVMITQPPWVAGANTDYFFYQLVEVAALATIAVVGAGRWAGLDRLVFSEAPAADTVNNEPLQAAA